VRFLQRFIPGGSAIARRPAYMLPYLLWRAGKLLEATRRRAYAEGAVTWTFLFRRSKYVLWAQNWAWPGPWVEYPTGRRSLKGNLSHGASFSKPTSVADPLWEFWMKDGNRDARGSALLLGDIHFFLEARRRFSLIFFSGPIEIVGFPFAFP